MEDFNVASTEGLSKLLKNKRLDPQEFLGRLVDRVDSGRITANQFSLLQQIATETLLDDSDL
jgi:hypothetical protein